MNRRTLKILSCLMAVAMITLCMAGFGTKVEVSAAETPYTEQLDISSYNEVAPKPANAEHKDWIFAGWYKDADCKEFITDKSAVSGQQYAKFVPADVLTVRCQNLAGTTAESGTTKMRIVTTVDSTYYKEVGFEFTIDGNTSKHSIDTVYGAIKATEGGVASSYAPTDFCADSEYFATVTIENISDFQKTFTIKPYWVTLDGTKVEGVSRMSRVEDSYLNLVNVPVRLYTDKMIAAGKVVVNYDKAKFEFYQDDNGNILDEMYVADNAEGKVTCVGNTEKANDVKADGLLVNLRFKVLEGNNDSTFEFKVNGEEFANSNEQLVYTDDSAKTFDVSDVVYKVISK